MDPQVSVIDQSSIKAGSRIRCMLMYAGATILVLLIVVLCVMTIIKYNDESNSNAYKDGVTTAFITAAYHQACRSNGGCCSTCPFISPDDPRSVITSHLKTAKSIRNSLAETMQNDTSLVKNVLNNMSDDAKVKEISSNCDSSSPQTTIVAVLNGILGKESDLYTRVDDIINQLKALNETYSDRTTIDVSLINAKTRATILMEAVKTYSAQFSIACSHLHSKSMMHTIQSTPSEQSKKIPDFDKRCMVANEKAGTNGTNPVSINGFYCDAISKSDKIHNIIRSAIVESTPSEELATQLVAIMNISKESVENAESAIRQLMDVSNLFKVCTTVRESFTNDLPGKLSAEQVTSLIESGDYETAIIKTALEPDIVSNHKKFAKERSTFESGGGIQSVRDDDNNLMPWVGLFGRPTFRKSNGASIELSNEVLKSIPSEYPDQVMRTSSLKLSTSKY